MPFTAATRLHAAVNERLALLHPVLATCPGARKRPYLHPADAAGVKEIVSDKNTAPPNDTQYSALHGSMVIL